jgi:rhodanese-related sulfurtransferase
MIRTKKPPARALLAEMAALVLTAALLGIAWNHKLLYQAWTGQAPTVMPESTQPRAEIALPLGLMQAKELYDRKAALFVDARAAGAFTEGHIKGAVSLPAGEVEAKLPRFIAEVPLTVTLVIYCNGYDCHDSRELGAGLLRAGYRTVYVFEGGFPEWRDAVYPADGGHR